MIYGRGENYAKREDAKGNEERVNTIGSGKKIIKIMEMESKKV